jgi:putative inorganic carbon (hco3(-)) transporter
MIYYGILLFFVLEYVRPSSYVPALNALHLNSLVPLAVFAGSLIGTSKKIKIADVLQSTNARWLMFLLLLLVISLLTCDVKTYAFDMFMAILSYCFMYAFLRTEIYDIDRIKGVFKILILVHFIVGALTPEMFSGDGQRHYIASGAFLGDGNDFALSVNVVIPLCLFMMLESRKFMARAFYAGILVILILAIVATQSRGGILSLVSVVLYLWIKSDKKLLGIVGIAFISLIILASAPPEFFERMETMTQTGEKMEGSAQGRIEAWKAAVRMAADHPLTGVGAGHFPVKYGVEYRPEGATRSSVPWQTAHSNYFVILGELGIPGIVFLVTIIVLNLKAGEQMLSRITAQRDNIENTYYRLTISLNASLIAFAVGGAFLTALRHPHLYLLAALLECGRYICNERLMSAPVVQNPPQAVPLTYGRVPV